MQKRALPRWLRSKIAQNSRTDEAMSGLMWLVTGKIFLKVFYLKSGKYYPMMFYERDDVDAWVPVELSIRKGVRFDKLFEIINECIKYCEKGKIPPFGKKVQYHCLPDWLLKEALKNEKRKSMGRQGLHG